MTLLYPLQSLAAHPARLSPDYRSTVKRAPSKPLIPMRHTLSELTGPVYGHETVREHDNDLTIQAKGEPLGERIIVHGHVLDEDGRGVPNALVELWQANACGRYVHVVDQHPAPLDPNFTGAGRTQSDDKGYYKFITIKPGAYPWGSRPIFARKTRCFRCRRVRCTGLRVTDCSGGAHPLPLWVRVASMLCIEAG